MLSNVFLQKHNPLSLLTQDFDINMLKLWVLSALQNLIYRWKSKKKTATRKLLAQVLSRLLKEAVKVKTKEFSLDEVQFF